MSNPGRVAHQVVQQMQFQQNQQMQMMMMMMMNLVNQVSGGEVQGAHGQPEAPPQGIPEAGSAWQQEQYVRQRPGISLQSTPQSK